MKHVGDVEKSGKGYNKDSLLTTGKEKIRNNFILTVLTYMISRCYTNNLYVFT